MSNPQLREPLRSEDPLARAEARARQIRELSAYTLDPVNEFDVPLEKIPAGWSYQWVRESVLGKEDTDNLMIHNAGGWEPVPASRHPELVPVGYPGKTIKRKGLILMERPQTVTDEARRREQRNARAAVHDKEVSLGRTPANTFPRDADPRVRARVETTYANPVEVPQD